MNSRRGIVVIAYHADCIDGYTAAWIVAEAMESRNIRFSILAMKHPSTSSELDLIRELERTDATSLYVVDFSLQPRFLKELQLNLPQLKTIILDHHKTAFEMYEPSIKWHDNIRLRTTIHGAEIHLDNNLSGASICWGYFGREPAYAQSIVSYVEDYDLWKFKLGDDTRYVNKYLVTLDKTLYEWRKVAQGLSEFNSNLAILERGKELQKAHDREVIKIANSAYPFTIAGKSCLAVQCPRKLVSDVGHILADRSGTFGACFQVNVQEGKVYWSLRSIDDYDVSIIAAKYGGGGHKNAAGFTRELF